MKSQFATVAAAAAPVPRTQAMVQPLRTTHGFHVSSTDSVEDRRSAASNRQWNAYTQRRQKNR